MHRHHRAAGVWLLAWLALGCSDLGAPLIRSAECSLSATHLEFGVVLVGGSALRSFSIRNEGQLSFSGNIAPSCDEFEVLLGDGAFRLGPGESRLVWVRFSPTAEGEFRCELPLGANCATVLLEGIADRPAIGGLCIVDALELDFGSVSLGESAARSLRLHNEGDVAVAGVFSSPCPDFLLPDPAAFALAPSDTLVVQLQFVPSSSGLQSCTLSTGVDCAAVQLHGEGAPTTTVSYATQVQPIFTRNCANERCHGNNAPAADLALTSARSYGELVGVPSQQYFPALRVVPGDSGVSVLYGKIIGDLQYGPRMPPAAPALNSLDRELIRVWIDEGALRN